MSTPEDAKRVVRELTNRYGFLELDMMEDIGKWNPEYRRRLDESWLALENTAAHAVKTLAKQIYGSGARFVFELLQNADDNSFKETANDGGDPFISFKVHTDQIIVECNEDGFTERDLNAISAVGQSTKSSNNGYIGAKGIGFKSVFIAAWKVHIHSGNYSFEFKHRKSDSGLGMVRPLWVDSDHQLSGPLTRMTLTLHDEGDEGDVEYLRSIIHNQFADLQPTCLLFLRKLRRISIEVYDKDGTLKSSKTFQKERVDEHRVSVKTSRFEDDQETTKSQMYHITTRKATRLTKSDNRDAPETDNLGTLLPSAEIILAFPLTSSFEPMIAGKQEIFAFLPIRESDYKFLIHTDFDTSANRQDIVTTSRRNHDLLPEIAETLVKAVLEFCDHPTLCYTWPWFLPKADDVFETFWSGMNLKVSSLLSKRACMRSRNRNGLRLISDVLTTVRNFEDENGDPLFDDEQDRFVSARYTTKAIKILKGYGLKMIDWQEVLDIVRADLRNSESRMRGDEMSNDWHSRVAKVLNIIHDDGLAMSVKALEIIPLKGGVWTSTIAQKVYYPYTDGIAIPDDLKISIIRSVAIKDEARKRLFDAVGVEHASIELVRKSILFGYPKGFGAITRYRYDLQYLYLTHTTETKAEYVNTYIVNSKSQLARPQSCAMYLPNRAGPFSPESLLAPTNTAPGKVFTLIHKMYMRMVPARPTPEHPTWDRWLYDLIGVRERLKLLSWDRKRLSRTTQYVFEHRKERFLDFFQHLWSTETHRLDDQLRAEIKGLPAKELCAVEFPVNLAATWLPMRVLKDLVTRYMTNPEGFPFLKLEQIDEQTPLELKWNFLHKEFSVGRNNDVSFLISILHYIQKAGVEYSSIGQIQKVYDLYTAIYAALISDDPQTESVFNHFQSRGIIVPDRDTISWVCSNDCRWIAPPNMVTTISLKSIYARTLGTEQLGNIGTLLQHHLKVKDASLSDVIQEFEHMRTNGCYDRDHAERLYDYLMRLDSPAIEVKAAFEGNALIYAVEEGEAGWFLASECLWSSPTKIRGKVILEEHYEQQRNFFVETLGLKSLTLQMLYDDLQHEEGTDINKLRDNLLTLSRFLQEDPEAAKKLETGPILRANIFPVRYRDASPELRTAQVDFAIGDRQHLTEHFKNQICLLDFKLEHVRPLGALISWAGLEERYLSRLVHEETFISDEHKRDDCLEGREVARKAYHILRLAATFGSARYAADRHGLYTQLRNSEVIKVKKITSVLRLTQNRQTYSSRERIGTFHMSDTEGGLKFYVPQNRKKRDTCFITSFPEGLGRWLMQEPNILEYSRASPEAVATLSFILTCGRSALDEVLDHRGIIHIDFENQTPDDAAEESEEADDASVSNIASELQSTSEARLTPVVLTSSSNVQNGAESVSRQTNYASSLPYRSILREVDDQYISLLNRVVRLARSSRFPPQGASDLGSPQQSLSNIVLSDDYDNYNGHDITFRFRSASQLDRDKKVGAAGELYVFEVLSGYELPDWSRSNWQSTIRMLVNAHQEYVDISPWTGRETADIVYNDTTGVLTRVLIDLGYLDRDGWDGVTPEYYIEVKTTTGPSKVPFFISENQYRLMRRVHENHTEDRSIVYLICRVFNVNSDSVGMQMYLDPEKLRQDGLLRFAAQAWLVTPGNATASEEYRPS